MGYELHIVRTRSWMDSTTDPITEEEWYAFAAADPELHVNDDSTYRVVGRSEPIYGVIWIGTGGASFVLWWNPDGRITARPRTDTQIAAMVAIARRLNARVVGDEDEEYGPDGRISR